PAADDESLAGGAREAEPRGRERAQEARAGRGCERPAARPGRSLASERVRAARLPRGRRSGGRAPPARQSPATASDGENAAAAAAARPLAQYGRTAPT